MENINVEEYYQNLNSNMVTYYDLINVQVKENGEKLVDVSEVFKRAGKNISTFIIDTELSRLTYGKILVRKELADRLIDADLILKKKNPEFKLQIICGYRPLEIQNKMYNEVYQELCKKQGREDIPKEEVHKYVAAPEVAGHPTGGAIDIQIVYKNDIPLDFGTKIMDFCRKSYTFSPEINSDAKSNRELLRNLLMSNGFAPFDGEWWHFSYKDREWSFYYKKSNAYYDAIEYKNIDNK